MEGSACIAISAPKSLSVRNPERNRSNRLKAKAEPKSIQDICQELATFREQTAEFFAEVRDLGSTGLNPKSVSDTASITVEDLEEVWGKVSTYRTTNTKLHPKTRRELISLYSKIYGTEDVTNNEFMMWVVKGFILECKGEAVDWATAAASTAREKAERCQRELEKCRLSESGNCEGLGSEAGAAGSSGSPPVYSFSTQSGKPVTKQVAKVGSGKRGAPTKLSKLGSSLSQERRHITEAELASIEEVLEVEIQFLESANNKVLSLGESRKKEADRIIGLRYNMEDRKSAAKESEDSMKVIESTLSALDCEISQAGDESTTKDSESLLLQLNTLKADRDRTARKLEIARFSVEENHRRAVQGEETYQNAEVDLWKANSDFNSLQREMTDMARHRDAIKEQLLAMKAGRGVCTWPRPVFHAQTPQDDTHFELQPCSFCNRFFDAFDIVVASCRHMYHPFCIASLCSQKNRCVTCRELFHPGWRRSFGFRDLDLNSEEKAMQPSKVVSDTKLSLQEDSEFVGPNCSQKQSDLGSCGSTLQGPKTDPHFQAAVVAVFSKDPEANCTAVTAAEEVNLHMNKSPSKISQAISILQRKSPVKAVLVKSSAVFHGQDSVVFQAATLSSGDVLHIAEVIPISIESAEQSEDVGAEEDGVQENVTVGEDLPQQNFSSAAEIATGKSHRYSFSKRRDSGPLLEDAPSSKTISLAEVCPLVNSSLSNPITKKQSKRKPSHKAEEDGSRKNQHRKNDNKKAESEAIETTPEITRSRVTRSSAKPTH